MTRLLTLDVSGGRGLNGRHGADGSSSGANGTDAGRATAGQPAGRLSLVVQVARSSNGAVGEVLLSGQWLREQERRVNERVSVGNEGTILLRACGGEGGAGGRGGDGQRGAKGSRGRDATQHFDGSDGGRGGDGGDGGNGTSGGDGGSGGVLTLTVPWESAALLMLFETDVRGGAGGAAGANGRGGEGGPGGEGGSSHSWTEWETETEYYTDSNGQRQSRTVQRSRTRHRSGGSRGASGSRGRDGNAYLRPGNNGADGTVEYVVIDGGQQRRYPGRYELELLDLELVSKDGDGVFEPGEPLHVRCIRVRNGGPMPLPAGLQVRIFGIDAQWVQGEPSRYLVLPCALEPGEEYTFTTRYLELRTVDPQEVSVGTPFRARGTVELEAMVPAVSRSFRGFKKEWPFELSFPAELDAIRAMSALAVGETTRVLWHLRNVAEKDLGSESALGRDLYVRIFWASGDLPAEHLLFTDSSGTDHELQQGFVGPVAMLQKQSGQTLEGQLRARRFAQRYTAATLRVELLLEHPEQKAQARVIQAQEFTIRIAQSSEFDPNADVLMVTNARTTSAEVNAWEQHCQSLGLTTTIWDLSLHGHLDLLQARPDGSSVLASLRDGHRTVLLLNHQCEMPTGKLFPSDFIDPKQQGVLADGAGGVLVVGDVEARPESLRLPDASEVVSCASVDELQQRVLADVAAHPKRVGAWSAPHTEWKVRATNEESLRSAAVSLMKVLSAKDPSGCYSVSWEYDPEELEEQRLFWFLWRVGWLRVRRVPRRGMQADVRINAEQNAIGDRTFYASSQPLLGLLCSLSPQTLCKVLLHVKNKDTLTLVSMALLAQSTRDVLDLCRVRGNHSTSEEVLARELPVLTQLATNEALRSLDPASPSGVALLEMLAAVRSMASSRVHWWEWFAWGRRTRAVRRVTRAKVNEVLTQVFGAEGERRELAEKELRAAEKRWKEQVSHADTKHVPKDLVLSCITGSLADAFVLPRFGNDQPENRVHSERSFQQQLEQRNEQQAWREGVAAANEAQRAELLLAATQHGPAYRGQWIEPQTQVRVALSEETEEAVVEQVRDEVEEEKRAND